VFEKMRAWFRRPRDLPTTRPEPELTPEEPDLFDYLRARRDSATPASPDQDDALDPAPPVVTDAPTETEPPRPPPIDERPPTPEEEAGARERQRHVEELPERRARARENPPPPEDEYEELP
jgi:hypothetical protein